MPRIMEDVWEVRINFPGFATFVPVRVPARNADEAKSRAELFSGQEATHVPVNLTELGIPQVPVVEDA